MSKKEIVTAFLQSAGSGNIQQAFDLYVDPNFKHHNQYFKGDRQSLLNAMTEASKASPNKSIQIKQMFEDRNTIISHSLVSRSDADLSQIVVIHIFRFENNKIIELWDLGQPILKESPNENGPF